MPLKSTSCDEYHKIKIIFIFNEESSQSRKNKLF